MTNNHRIVSIVDDELDITRLFQDAIVDKFNEIAVVSFTNPLTALEHFKENKEAYVLVISDLRMPELNGTELLRKMKKLNKFVRTILMTAFEIENPTLRDYTKKEIINAFVQKPIRLTDLIELVRSELDTYEIQKRVPNKR